jgi:3-hydroxyacyl-CoA dehydrogenase
VDIVRIGIVGGGIMGSGIAQCLAIARYEVVVTDINATALDRAMTSIRSGRFGLERAKTLGKISEEPSEILRRIRCSTERADLGGSDLIIEAIPEDLPAKQQLFKELDRDVNPDTILASNTSGYPIGEVSAWVSAPRRERFAGMHFASPVPVMKMCEIIRTERTAEATLETLGDVAHRIGKVVSSVRDAPGTYGFILNRVFAAARREADAIVRAGIATEEDVDRAMVNGRNWPVGFYGADGARTGWA